MAKQWVRDRIRATRGGSPGADTVSSGGGSSEVRPARPGEVLVQAQVPHCWKRYLFVYPGSTQAHREIHCLNDSDTCRLEPRPNRCFRSVHGTRPGLDWSSTRHHPRGGRIGQNRQVRIRIVGKADRQFPGWESTSRSSHDSGIAYVLDAPSIDPEVSLQSDQHMDLMNHSTRQG